MKKREKSFSPLRLGTRLVIVICFVFMTVAMLRFGVKNILMDRGGWDSKILSTMSAFVYGDNPGAEVQGTNRVTVKWKKLYPFEDTQTENVQTQKKKNTDSQFQVMTNQIEQRVDTVKEQISYYFDTGLFLRNALLETGTMAEYVFCWDIPEEVKDSPYVFLGGRNGYIVSCKKEVDSSEGADNLSEFAKWVQAQGSEFLYVQYPEKMSCSNSDILPKGYVTYSDKNVDSFLQQIEDNNIPYYDTRSELIEEEDTMFELFFRTDHHWLPQTGLQVAGMIAEYLWAEEMGVNMELFELDQYNVEVYEDVFLGSYGREVTAAMIEPDDFSVITPKFETSLKISIPNLSLEREGRFEDTLLNMKMLYQKPSYELSMYEVYCWGDRPLIEIENRNTDNQNKVLIVKDSFSDVVIPYLALATKELSVIDLRYFTGSLKSYIERFKPDSVIVAYNPGTISAAFGIDYTSNNSQWDFR